jgi:hypothetical protein
VDDPVDLVDRVVVGGRVRGLDAAALVDATSTITVPFFMSLSMSRVTSRGAVAPGMSTAPTTRSASCRYLRMLAGLETTGKQLGGMTSLR